MLCELVRTQTQDFVRLNGAFFRTSEAAHQSLDAALLFPGLAGNFYSSRLIQSIARQFNQRGVNVLQANTRGHDGINWISRGGRTEAQGAAFEVVDECRFDIDGWIQFLLKRGLSRLAIIGHSLGAIKALYSQANQPNAAVQSVAALSASRLNYDHFMQTSAAAFGKWIERAKQLVADGAPRQLMRVDFPFPAFIAADTYLDKYGPPSRYDWTQFIQQVKVPVLLTFGERELESNAAFQGIVDQVDRLRAAHPAIDVRVVPGADHFYTGRRQVISKITCQWVCDRKTD